MIRPRLWLLLAIAGGAAAGGCDDTSCGDGTVESNGTCVPADQTVGTATCGPGTVLQGDQCVTTTTCDDNTTMPVMQPDGSIVCVAISGTGCSAPIACDAPTDGTQTICGQLYDFATDQPYQAANPTGQQCAGTETMGPCALAIQAYDAYVFGQDPQHTPPLATGPVYIDDCGRYRVPNIPQPSGPFVGLGIDDRDTANLGPGGVTNAVGLATGKSPNSALKNFDGFIVTPATTTAWATNGAPTIAEGYFAAVFHATSSATDRSPYTDGVKVTRGNLEIPDDDYYFSDSGATRMTVAAGQDTAGADGTGLVDHAMVTEMLAYSGTVDTLPSGCRWESHAGATLPGIVFVQIFRPINAIGFTCTL